jgi:dihydroorotase
VYRAKILQAAIELGFPYFDPLMTVKITPATTPEIVYGAKEVGAVGGKLYPDGVTTGSEGGVRDFEALYPVFAAMQSSDMVLELHGEHPGEDIFCLDREGEFLKIAGGIAQNFPKLKIVLEHLSTAEAVEFVRQHDNVAATITPHHLLLTLDDVVGDKLRPHHFCKPIAKRPEDRCSLIEAAVSGQSQFFLGTDSAPWLVEFKECAEGCAGVFNTPVALPLLAELFDREGAIDRLEGFTSINGPDWYELPLSDERLELVRESWAVPADYLGIVPLWAGRELQWQVRGT